ncbi:TetR/AcrR family transcriptional regulator [Paracoccus tibetensis]|uniref:Transcriptional regulator, TetR family n=1 Tax=Paracoccus tibetensis TaxID=336292 RepID=A0A1G5BWN4_9RHOB|nr:TetR/AcrR family transcriptional regulator [Paracoccus tibetensis]SCX94477.1 transcriptional regulator, TetR family [Paracoccus tibetensis]
MSSDLRERRRRQTADDIQRAALRLALRCGFEALTTEAIAAEAGVSPRTFFNYYANKQAALLGRPPRMDADEACWIVHSDAPLLDDLVALLTGLVEDGARLDRPKIRMVRQVLDASPELEPLFHDMLEGNTRVLAGLLQQRLGMDAPAEAELIAGLATGALSHAVRDWASADDLPAAEIKVLLRRRLQAVCRLLCA